MAKKTSPSKTEPIPLSTPKKILFYGITFSVPILFFLILELVLHGINYKGNNDLFIDPGITLNEYLVPNPNFASRYFFYTKTVPNPAADVFLKHKPENGFRVFAMGGSSAAGYPYGFNGMFSRVVRDVLQDAMPDKTVEVINVGISAISSYTLFDQVNEIIEQEPDAIMIYAGHNEFYGALGVGSNEKLGSFPGFVRFYLKLQRFKTFLFLRSIIVNTGKWITETLGTSSYDESATLMERIIDSRAIELGDPKYQLAMTQFESNMSTIIRKYREAGIPVFIGSVASNLKDQPPFVDIPNSEQPSAQQTFANAKNLYKQGEFASALEEFTLAKDLDGLKFRAPKEINNIIRTLSTQNGVHYVPVYETMAEYVDDGIIGFELMLEHLHPNRMGYFLIGKAFSLRLMEEFGIQPSELPLPVDAYFNQMQMTEYDEWIAFHRVQTLRQGFPFVRGSKPQPYQLTYQFKNAADSLAFLTVHMNIPWDKSKLDLATYYEKTGQKNKALAEYHGLIRNQPWNDAPYIFAARILLDRGALTEAEPLLEKAYQIYPKDAFTTKMLGAIMVSKGNAERAIKLLEESRLLNPNDPQMLYNLSGAYFTSKQYQKALEIARQVEQISPNFPGNQQWIQQLQSIINK